MIAQAQASRVKEAPAPASPRTLRSIKSPGREEARGSSEQKQDQEKDAVKMASPRRIATKGMRRWRGKWRWTKAVLILSKTMSG